jgi:hypothetical protein
MPKVQTFTPIQPGDMVAYSQAYIDRQAVGGNNLIYARGKVSAVHRIAEGTLLADVAWDTAGLPKRVFVKDIIKLSPIRLSET